MRAPASSRPFWPMGSFSGNCGSPDRPHCRSQNRLAGRVPPVPAESVMRTAATGSGLELQDEKLEKITDSDFSQHSKTGNATLYSRRKGISRVPTNEKQAFRSIFFPWLSPIQLPPAGSRIPFPPPTGTQDAALVNHPAWASNSV